VGGFAPSRPATFELIQGEEDASPSRVTVNRETGRFEIEDVLPGAYTLRVTQDQTSGETGVTVGGADVDGVKVELQAAVEVKGTVRFTNAEPKVLGGIGAGECQVELRHGEKVVISHDGDGGTFSMGTVLPGRYRVTVACSTGYVNSVMAGRQDLFADAMLSVGAGTPPIEIVATHGGGTVEVGVTSRNGEVEPPGVLLVPNFSSTGPVWLLAGRVPNQPENTAEFSGLAPGTYTAYGLAVRTEVPFRDPAFLASLTGGVTVQVTDPGTTEVRLEVRQ
jgi:hypothetical protein